jgi:hypothetical protein
MENQLITIGPFVLVAFIGMAGLIVYLLVKIIKRLR